MALTLRSDPVRRARMWLALVLGLAGALAGLALPFVPVHAQTTTVTWPPTGQPVISSTATVVPYRPLRLRATVPCQVLRAAAAHAQSVTVLATGTDNRSLSVTGLGDEFSVAVGGQTVPLRIGRDDMACRILIDAGPAGVQVGTSDPNRTVDLPGQPVPQVFGFRTGLAPPDAAGVQVSVDIGDPFTTSPTALKVALIVAQLTASAMAMWLLPGPARRLRRLRWPSRWRRVWWIDVGVIGALAGWAVIGPLAVDDGWATMIARNVAATGNPGNYFRWWNAAETPFALCEQLLAPLTTVSLAPLWLRLPSTVLAIATWWVLTRGVLPGALPGISSTGRVRGLAAVCLLAAWLPFNLGARPESYVALGVTAVLALAMRARSPAGVGAMLLIAACTIAISPNSVLVAAPILVYAPRLIAIVRAASPTRLQRWALAAQLVSVAAVALTIIFADQTWDALTVATDWHTFFGPSLPWYDEPVRYHYLLQSDQQGSFAKRVPILLSAVLLAVIALLTVRRRDRIGTAARRLTAVVIVALALFALSPSKWSYHLGAAAGLFAAQLTVGIILLCRRTPAPGRYAQVIGAAGAILTAFAAALAFDGPNAWWLPAIYDVPWPTTPPHPFGAPLNQPLVWIGGVALVVAAAVIAGRRHAALRIVAGGPAVVAVTVMATALMLVAGSFVAAPIRRHAGSLALINVHWITGGRACGLADDVEVLPDGAVLNVSGEAGEQVDGFIRQGGFFAAAPPPDPVGAATSRFVWGSRGAGDTATGVMTSPWFTLPPLGADGGVALSVSGRTDAGNTLTFGFGRSDGTQVAVLGERTPPDHPPTDDDPAHPLWRTIGIDAADIPAGANRIQVRARDARTDSFGWLAFTGPRLRSVIPLTRFLAEHGPVLISWPQSFLFPCVHNIATVTDGVAQTPATVIESPRPWFGEDRDPNVGGTFAELAVFGDLHEVPSRLAGHPDIDWGSVLVSGDTTARDTYQRTVTTTTVPGIGGSPHPPAER